MLISYFVLSLHFIWNRYYVGIHFILNISFDSVTECFYTGWAPNEIDYNVQTGNGAASNMAADSDSDTGDISDNESQAGDGDNINSSAEKTY